MRSLRIRVEANLAKIMKWLRKTLKSVRELAGQWNCLCDALLKFWGPRSNSKGTGLGCKASQKHCQPVVDWATWFLSWVCVCVFPVLSESVPGMIFAVLWVSPCVDKFVFKTCLSHYRPVAVPDMKCRWCRSSIWGPVALSSAEFKTGVALMIGLASPILIK